MKAKVALVGTRPETIMADYRRVMELAGYREHLSPERDLILKLNLSWTKYFPACSSQPWQLEGVVKTLREDGFVPEHLIPLENKTVVTDPRKGCRNNLWGPVLSAYDLTFRALPEEEWVDAAKITHIVENLLENALKFTGHGHHRGTCCSPASRGWHRMAHRRRRGHRRGHGGGRRGQGAGTLRPRDHGIRDRRRDRPRPGHHLRCGLAP